MYQDYSSLDQERLNCKHNDQFQHLSNWIDPWMAGKFLQRIGFEMWLQSCQRNGQHRHLSNLIDPWMAGKFLQRIGIEM